MKIAKVIVEYQSSQVDRTFNYLVKESQNLTSGSRVNITFNNRKIIGYVLEVVKTNKTKQQLEQQYGFELKYIEEVIDEESLLDEDLTKVAFYMQENYFAPLITCLQTMLPKNLKPQSVKKSKPLTANFLTVNENIDVEKLTIRQKQLYEFIKLNKKVSRNTLKDFSSSIIKTLIDREVLIQTREEVFREVHISDDKFYQEQYELTSEQKEVFNSVISKEDTTFLLEGVTGSGKSEVYLRLTQHYLNKGKGVIVLVPEIVLTSQLAARFKYFLKDELALLHSGLSDGEKYDEYRKIKQGLARVVIGTRSAIFAPVQNLGLIIVDEEHSTSYKQDKVPCYHAIDIALVRKENLKINVLLGSATPSVESKVYALTQKYEQLYLHNRINQFDLPIATMVDINNEENLISPKLKEEMQQTLANKEQVILLLNRRGYAPYVRCKLCLYVFKCVDCEVALNYHLASNSLKCHYCSKEYKEPKKCPMCGSEHLDKSGYGTQKIEEIVKEMFTEARVKRMDADSTTRKNAHQQIVSKMINNEIDILIGTQMVAKGLDFPNVTLVGVLNADASLNASDFRATERTFQLLVQVLGRSGRANKIGKAIIQTYRLDNKVLLQAAKHDYSNFIYQEINFRKQLNYPPFRILAYVELRSEDFFLLNKVSNLAKQYLDDFKDKDFQVYGPSQPYLNKIGKEYRLRIMLKYKNKHKTIEIINDLKVYLSKYRKINLYIQVDPYSDI